MLIKETEPGNVGQIVKYMSYKAQLDSSLYNQHHLYLNIFSTQLLGTGIIVRKHDGHYKKSCFKNGYNLNVVLVIGSTIYYSFHCKQADFNDLLMTRNLHMWCFATREE